ncbi:MAG: FG-GAP repeat domain-containing protein, partial [Solirubrobacterales bacterium]
MRASSAFGLALALAAGCGNAPSLVVVSVDAQPMLSGVTTLHVHAATDDGAAMDYDFGDQDFTLPPAKTFGLSVGDRYRGLFAVTVTARSASGVDLGTATGSVALNPGRRSDLPLTIGALGTDGGAVPDLGQVVPISFGRPTSITAPASRGALVGDFNNDSKLDLVSEDNTAPGTATLSLLLGNGDGTFQPAKAVISHTTSMAYVDGAAALDFNHDGRLDLAISNATGGDLSILFGNGDGTFQAAVNYAFTHPGGGC